MDKKVFIAFGLSFVLIVGVLFLNKYVLPQPEIEIVANESTVVNSVEVEPEKEVDIEDNNVSIADDEDIIVPEDIVPAQDLVFENDLFKLVFTTKGAEVKSFILKGHIEDGQKIDMVLNDGTNQNAFQISFDDNRSNPIDSVFDYEISNDGLIYTFTKSFVIDGKEPFTLTKRYEFVPDEYMFSLEIDVENSVNSALPLDSDGYAYTLTYGPQIGPDFEKLDGRYSFRKFYVNRDNGTKQLKMGRKDTVLDYEESFSWAAISSKYFAVIAIPDGNNSSLTIENGPIPGQENSAFISISRLSTTRASLNDVYRFYIGTKEKEQFERYELSESNFFKLKDNGFDGLQGGFIKPFEKFLKWCLDKINLLFKNYGVSIIVLTILLKFALYPITKKSFASTSKMQSIQPLVTELKEKYKDDAAELNKKTMELYKTEGVNPMGGCLPMLLQMPLLISVYQMLSNSFDLRGASFIKGWIPNLAVPEFVYMFDNFEIPLLGSAIRLLPLIYLGTQLISMKFTQTPQAGQSGMQAKMFTLIMPIMFFFMLYNLPSGLFVYWIVMNIVTTLQQIYINKIQKNKPDSGGMKKAKKIKRK